MRYVKKPIPVFALRWNGVNFDEIMGFMENNHPIVTAQNELVISTLEGDMRAPVGAYIIKGIKGEFYPCDGEIFEQTYEPYEEDKYVHEVKCPFCEEDFKTVPSLFYDSVYDVYMYAATCPRCKKRVEWRVMS